MSTSFTWSEAKRESNLAKHRLDFLDAVGVFTGVSFTVEDTRGLFREVPVCIIHTDHAEQIRILSFRKATRREAEIYFDEIRY